jgi:ribosome-associated protein
MRAVADAVMHHGRSAGQKCWHVAGLDSAEWVILDFVDVVVHVFDESRRRYYDLELIWGEAPKVRWQRRRAPTMKQTSQ